MITFLLIWLAAFTFICFLDIVLDLYYELDVSIKYYLAIGTESFVVSGLIYVTLSHMNGSWL